MQSLRNEMLLFAGIDARASMVNHLVWLKKSWRRFCGSQLF